MERHVKDSDIQALLDGTAGDRKELISSHMQSCKQCTEKYRQYQKLAGMLSVPPKMELAAGFPDKVLHHPDFPIVFQRKYILPYISSLIIAVAACAGMFVYLGINPKNYFSTIFNLSFLESVRNLMNLLNPVLSPFFQIFRGRTDLILFSFLALVIVLLIDRFILRALAPNSDKPSPPSFPLLI